MKKEEIILDLELIKKEIRLGAQRNLSDFERDQHLAEAIITANCLIGKIQISETLDSIFDGIVRKADGCPESDFSVADKPFYQTVICPHCSHKFTADLNDRIICPECHEEIKFDPQFPEFDEVSQIPKKESLFPEDRQ